MNSKMTTNSRPSSTEPKKTKQQQQKKTQQSKQIEQEQNHRKWRSHGGLSARREKGREGEKVQGIRSVSINGR